MKRIMTTMIALMVAMSCTFSFVYATNETGSLSDLLEDSANEQVEAPVENNTGSTQGTSSTEKSRQDKDRDFMSGLVQSTDLTTEVEGVREVTSGIRLVASWIIQVLSYAVTVLLTLRVVLDLVYIGLPFMRTILANGYAGNAQAGAGGVPNSMAPGMGMGMGGMNRGGYGMNRGMGMGMGMGAMGGMGGMGAMGGMGGMNNTSNINQNGSMVGRIQWVSNAALNAVASESTVDAAGKANTPFKAYIKDMMFVLVLTPILLTLAITGTLTNLGFLIGNLLCDMIAGVGEMI